MKPKYSIGEVVKIKATGEKVEIASIDEFSILPYRTTNHNWYAESELSKYCPSRTGKHRDRKGRFVSKKPIDLKYGICTECKSSLCTCKYRLSDGCWDTDAEMKDKYLDSKQRSQKIEKISHRMSVKKSSTLGGQRELVRELTNKINELIDHVTELEKKIDRLSGVTEYKNN